MKIHMGVWKYSSTIPDLGTRWRWVVSFALLPLYPQGKSRLYPLDRKLGQPQSRSERRGERRSLAPAGNWTPGKFVPRLNTDWKHWCKLVLFIYFNCKWVFTRWQCFYSKTQHTKNTQPSNKTHHTKLHKKWRTNYANNEEQTTHNEHNANTITITTTTNTITTTNSKKISILYTKQWNSVFVKAALRTDLSVSL
jgi:hypothetical protein